MSSRRTVRFATNNQYHSPIPEFLEELSWNLQHRAHPCLTPSIIRFNIMHHPNTLYHHRPELAAAQNELAFTHPPLLSILIISRHIPWQLPVHASNGYSVTVGDIIQGINKGLRRPITREEYDQEDEPRQLEIAQNFYNRIDLYPTSLRKAERESGIRRVDFLNERYLFAGLSRTESPNIWRLGLEKGY